MSTSSDANTAGRKRPFARDIDDLEVQAHALVPCLVLAGQAGFYDRALPDLEALAADLDSTTSCRPAGLRWSPLSKGSC